MPTNRLSLSVLPLSLVATGLLAQPAEPDETLRQGVEQMLLQLDADGDGLVQISELPEGPTARAMAEADGDADGVLTSDELLAAATDAQSARLGGAAEGLMAELDTDGDGLIQSDEALNEQMTAWLAEVDSDGDGAVDVDELRQWVTWRQQHETRTIREHGRTMAEEIMRQFDADGDGSIEIATELPSEGAASELVVADQDGDGSISTEEMMVFADPGGAPTSAPAAP